ncbi:UDP-glucose 6-dehydrogenase [Magnetococcus marinus MC-1]|uniref:UDP-glucose 6-dehydrogenase n=1 Tax=Magnetococcus marinus (strain ATCC BAA-1437 / JCM 17883 / MC-1) TaxID=156889 RepID=A0L4G6_MAGMM|nr:UDP-glucose/GDP-mannose dehydrogenase family protein [Magnetococcus marinus]ABK42859.1 UDP-glucose 6-dehydrogenase [Magnetococcus marinus MC-1]
MRITMIGTGYVGLVSGACFSEFGVDVTCVDKDVSKIERLNKGEIPIFEPGLDQLVVRNKDAGRLHFTTDTNTAVANSDVVFIAVGTPERRGDGAADLRYVFDAARDVARAMQGFTVVVTKSTVPVGTGARVAEIIRETKPDADFAMASNPEFLREGSAIEDFMRPDRVVVGVDSDRPVALLKELYRPLYLIETPILFTNIATAELTKYAGNAFLATKIMFINQIANLCEKVGADVHDVAKGMGLDRRIGRKFLHPGPGYGGSCFPKDTAALANTARDHNTPMTIVENVIEANKWQKQRMITKIRDAMQGKLRGKTIGVLGLTFKPNTDDMRDSSSLTILPALAGDGARIQAFDPEGMHEAKRMMPELHYCDDAYSACQGADAVVILTEWNQFRNLDLDRIKAGMQTDSEGLYPFFDLRNIYVPADMRAQGFAYVGVGR